MATYQRASTNLITTYPQDEYELQQKVTVYANRKQSYRSLHRQNTERYNIQFTNRRIPTRNNLGNI